MLYLLDTNICIYIIKKRPPEVLEKFITCSPGDIGLSVITVAELRYGAQKSAYPDKKEFEHIKGLKVENWLNIQS